MYRNSGRKQHFLIKDLYSLRKRKVSGQRGKVEPSSKALGELGIGKDNAGILNVLRAIRMI